MKARTFVDSVVVYAEGGAGGNGCVSFRREKYVPRGGPDGGDGGHGGSVVLRADHDVDSLIALFYTPHQRAGRGGHGKGKKLHGRNGGSLIVPVPCGTEIWDREANSLIADLLEHGAEQLVAAGGRGGLGNCHWKTSTHQAPTEHTDGAPGEERALRLELKLVSDVGLVGFPNAGKSSLLTRISDAHPKVAAYPFTTLNPIIGTVIFEDYTRLRVADIPGIIADAHAGVGLGTAFLRHIERSRHLAYVIDMAGVDGRDPVDDYTSVRRELELYRADLLSRPSLCVANKMDAEGAVDNLRTFEKETGLSPLPVSALNGDGIPELRDALHRLTRGAR